MYLVYKICDFCREKPISNEGVSFGFPSQLAPTWFHQWQMVLRPCLTVRLGWLTTIFMFYHAFNSFTLLGRSAWSDLLWSFWYSSILVQSFGCQAFLLNSSVIFSRSLLPVIAIRISKFFPVCFIFTLIFALIALSHHSLLYRYSVTVLFWTHTSWEIFNYAVTVSVNKQMHYVILLM